MKALSAAEKFAKAVTLSMATQPESDLQGVCHELQEIIEGENYIIEDAQFALNYARKTLAGSGLVATLFARIENELGGMIRDMTDIKATAQLLYDSEFNCRRARERAGFATER